MLREGRVLDGQGGRLTLFYLTYHMTLLFWSHKLFDVTWWG